MNTSSAVLLVLLALGVQCEGASERRETLRRAMVEGIAVVYGEGEEGYQGFRQSSDFLYLTGIEIPGSVLLLVAGLEEEPAPEEKKPERRPVRREVLFLPSHGDEDVRWVGDRLHPDSPPEALRAAGFDDVRDVEAFPSVLRRSVVAWADRPVDLWLLYEEGTPGRPLGPELLRVGDLRDRFPHARIRPLRPLLARQRQIKDADEVRLIRGAIEITAVGLERAMTALEPGMTELQLRSVIEGAFLHEGAPRLGFTSIVGSGPNATVLHYPAGRRRMESGDLVVVDVGAEVEGGYAADLTRTLPVSGRFTPRQRKIYRLVLKAQEAAFEAVRPGATLPEVHGAARRVLEEGGYGEAFWHGTSHWLGLEVHDVGDRKRPLEPGMVFTVEPGVYLPEEGFGIRIEDDVLVTEEGSEVLSSGVPRTAEELEAAMAGSRRRPR